MSVQSDFEDLIDALETNLQTMGVTDAQFDSATGLMGLVSRILDIPSSPSSSISLTSDKSILSYVDDDVCNLTATINDSNNDGVTGELVVLFDSNDNLIGVMTDEGDGTYSYTYTSQGIGDIGFKAQSSTFVSETYSIEDCNYFNDGTSTTGITMSSGVSVTIDNGALKITTSTSGEKYINLPVSMANSDNFIFEFEIARTGTTQHFATYVNSASTANGLWWAYDNSASRYVGGLTGTSLDKSGEISVGDVLKYKQENGVVTLYRNDSVMNTKSSTFPTSPFGMGFYTNYGRVQYLKNIKVKPL